MDIIYMILGVYFLGVIINSLIALVLIINHKRTHIVTSVSESFDPLKMVKFVFLSWYSFDKAVIKVLNSQNN
jgi:hypothetical protein